MAVLLVSVGLYGSNINTSYAQNNALSQSGNSEAEQAIEQSQSSKQAAQCVSGEITALSCNNLGLQVQSNSDDDDGNGNGGNPPPGEFPRDICHVSASGQEETLEVQNQQQYEAHVGNPAHPDDYDGQCETDPE
jgi:hypothetical protein